MATVKDSVEAPIIKSNNDNDYSSSGFAYEVVMTDNVTAQLAAAGPAGVAAAAAIHSVKNRSKLYKFESNPSVRRRQRNRLIKKLQSTIDEFSTTVGQQAVLLIIPAEESDNYEVFGAKPLKNVIKDLKYTITNKLNKSLAKETPQPRTEESTLFQLPPLIVNGIPTPLNNMTQAQLRTFIPLMLKYSMGRGKPGWGRESTKPPWWPDILPWANIRMDSRNESEKQNVPWTYALQRVVFSCYKFHGREDLLPSFTDEDKEFNIAGLANTPPIALDTIKNVTNDTHSILKVDPDNPKIPLLLNEATTHAQIMAVIKDENFRSDDPLEIQSTQEGEADTFAHTIQTITGGAQVEVVNLDLFAKPTFNLEGQIVLKGEDGNDYSISTKDVITVPDSTYQRIIDNIQYLHTNADSTETPSDSTTNCMIIQSSDFNFP